MTTGAIVGSAIYEILVVGLLGLLGMGSIVTYIIIVVANRAEPDPTGNRTRTVYHAGAAFVTLWVELTGVYIVFSALFGLIGAGGVQYYGTEIHPLGDATIRSLTIGVLMSLIGGFVTLHQRHQAVSLAEADGRAESPAKRVVRSYAAIVSFISTIALVIVALAGLWAFLGLVAPGVYDAGSRTDSLRLLLDLASLFIIFGWTFSLHRHLVDPRSDAVASPAV